MPRAPSHVGGVARVLPWTRGSAVPRILHGSAGRWLSPLQEEERQAARIRVLEAELENAQKNPRRCYHCGKDPNGPGAGASLPITDAHTGQIQVRVDLEHQAPVQESRPPGVDHAGSSRALGTLPAVPVHQLQQPGAEGAGPPGPPAMPPSPTAHPGAVQSHPGVGDATIQSVSSGTTLTLGRPSLSTRKAGLLAAAGETTVFADDALVVIPGPGASAADVVMQYRISGYTGTASPSLEWQSASEETWRGEAQWCFTLPRGRMSVEARAVSTATGGVSEPSAPVAFLVRASGN